MNLKPIGFIISRKHKTDYSVNVEKGIKTNVGTKQCTVRYGLATSNIICGRQPFPQGDMIPAFLV